MAIAESEKFDHVYASRAAERFMEWFNEGKPKLTLPAYIPAGMQVRLHGLPPPVEVQVLIPEHCRYAEAHMRTEWPQHTGPRDSWKLWKEQQNTAIRAHYTRNLREWPTCPHGGGVQIHLWSGPDTEDIARGKHHEPWTYVLACAHCRKRLGKPCDGVGVL
jgi:hypothetical protein